MRGDKNMIKEWAIPGIITVNLSETANSDQPSLPSDELWYDYYHECSTCS